jgi:hypothetical protein
VRALKSGDNVDTIHHHLVILTLTAVALLPLIVTLPGSDALAQQKQLVSYTAAAENTKYPQQLNIDVGDVPNHVVRIFEIHRAYPNNPPIINGSFEAMGAGAGSVVSNHRATT